MWNLDKRVWAHKEIPDQRWVDIIAFEDGWEFPAPALEFFLIKNLKPPHNKTYREY